MLKINLQKLYSLNFAQRLTIILLLFALVPLLSIQQIMMHLYERHIITEASQSTLAVVKANNSVLTSVLDGIENASNMMLNNEFYYDIFSRLEDLTVGDCLRYDRLIPVEMAKAFSQQEDIYKSYLYTSKWIFNTNSSLIHVTNEGFHKAGYDQIAREAGGEPCWITGSDYGKSIGSNFLQDKGNYAYQYPLTMVREMDFQRYNYSGLYQKLSAEIEKPILVVHVLESDIQKLFQGSINFEGTLYLIVNRDGIVVSSDNDLIPTGSDLQKFSDPGSDLSDISHFFSASGYLTCQLDGQDFLLCYDPLKDGELLSLAFVPRSILLKSTVSTIRHIQFFSITTLIICSFLVAAFLSRTITLPIQKLINASIRVAGGDFSANTPVPKGGDFKLLTESFNHMEREINHLILQNYEISLREKESQLAALSMQINPHFLYNTLNTINLLAIQNDDEETSNLIVDLSEMLQYTFKSFAEKMPLSEEIGWVSNYLHIMSKRYDNVFRTQLDIDENLMDTKVPKLLLQPLVENSILHGFSHTRENGLLSITISQKEDNILFLIRDNGQGMTKEQLANYMLLSHPQSHVGLSNVRHRLSLLYGENYQFKIKSAPGDGTEVSILIPLEITFPETR